VEDFRFSPSFSCPWRASWCESVLTSGLSVRKKNGAQMSGGTKEAKICASSRRRKKMGGNVSWLTLLGVLSGLCFLGKRRARQSYGGVWKGEKKGWSLYELTGLLFLSRGIPILSRGDHDLQRNGKVNSYIRFRKLGTQTFPNHQQI